MATDPSQFEPGTDAWIEAVFDDTEGKLSREQKLEVLLRSVMQLGHCYDDTFREPPDEREACFNLGELHAVARDMDQLGMAPPLAHASWAALWPDQNEGEDEDD